MNWTRINGLLTLQNSKIEEEQPGVRPKKEALRNLQEVIRLVLEDMAECGELPSFESEIKKKGVIISSEPLITVTV